MSDDPDTETLSAFVDGALPADEMSRIARWLEDHPEQDAWVGQQESLRAGLHAQFATVLDEEIPAALLATLEQTPLSWRWRLRHAAWFRWGLAPGAVLAAGVAAVLLWQTPQTRPGTDLTLALNQQLASEPGASLIHIGLTFRNKLGAICRSYSSSATAGYACRDNGDWRVALQTVAPAPSAGAYQMAGSTMPDALRTAIESAIQGAPFDAMQERAARTGHWQ